MRDLFGPETILSYCTNVHPAPSLGSLHETLRTHAAGVRNCLGLSQPMGVGLWMPAPVARNLRQSAAELYALASLLDDLGLAPCTFNGFPHGDFHQPVVKHRVYEPDWASPDRLAYTLDLAEILAALLPDSAEGSISTLPLGWRGRPCPAWSIDAAADHLCSLARHLAALEARTGRWIHVDLEPEPGCALDRGEHVVRFFEDHLLRNAASRANVTEAVIRRHLGVCHDICHAAVMREPQADVIDRYVHAGIMIGKVQISSAITARFDLGAPDHARAMLEQLRAFAEDRYLHQTTLHRDSRSPDMFFTDLPDAIEAIDAMLADRRAAGVMEARVHFHVPINRARFDHLSTTQPDVIEACRALRLHSSTPLTRHLEVETYAWGVLPPSLQPATLARGIADEMQWVIDHAAPTRASRSTS